MLSPKNNRPPCYGLKERLAHIKDTYRRFALVSHPQHLQMLDPNDHDTLIVSCNWLLWQMAVNEGWHCVHAESDWNGEDSRDLTRDVFLRSNDWIYVDGIDVTLFRGVSLGRKLLGSIRYVIMEQEQFRCSLDTLVKKYHPEKVVFFDFRTEFSVLGADARCAIVSRLLSDRGVKVIKRIDPPDSDDTQIAQVYSRSPPEPAINPWIKRAKPALLKIFEFVSTSASSFRCALRRRWPRILLLISHMNGIPLIDSFDGKGVVPLYLAKWFPKRKDLKFLARSIAKGIFLLSRPDQPVTNEEIKAIDHIKETLIETWENMADPKNSAIRDYILQHILTTDHLAKLAEDVKWAEAVLDCYRPTLIFTDGLQTPIIDTFLELAKQRNIGTSATWTAHSLLTQAHPVLGCDPRFNAGIDCFLTWGKGGEDWLKAIDARCRIRRTGYPISPMKQLGKNSLGSRKRVLLLQYATSYADLRWPQAEQFPFFVESVRMLRAAGFQDIRMKLHPRGAETLGYHERIAEYFDLDCEIFCSGVFSDFIDWADVIIGPVSSGAMLEVMAVGKPYFPILLPNTSVAEEFLEGYPVYSNVETLREAIISIDDPQTNEMFNYFTGLDHIPDPAGRTWDVLRHMAVESQER